MTRRLLLSLALAVIAGQTVPPPPATPASAAEPSHLDDLMMDLSIAPLQPAPAPALTVSTLEGGGRVSLADMKGRAVLVYFWATW